MDILRARQCCICQRDGSGKTWPTSHGANMHTYTRPTIWRKNANYLAEEHFCEAEDDKSRIVLLQNEAYCIPREYDYRVIMMHSAHTLFYI